MIDWQKKAGELIAAKLAPQAVSLTTDYNARMREAQRNMKKKMEFLQRENKRLRTALEREQDLRMKREATIRLMRQSRAA